MHLWNKRASQLNRWACVVRPNHHSAADEGVAMFVPLDKRTLNSKGAVEDDQASGFRPEVWAADEDTVRCRRQADERMGLLEEAVRLK